ncbi:EAL domain-containing protein [Shewanella sp. AS1]|uniref:putative bifunctional diguanylate cyclase/phosphodiesterase n=1 Tax=Shewanella sp. AS1 TaxID=2907626 RepID=UPI001F46F077|nr:GGDEF domain-containing phosphodiesterase [Shewanella sp. AS1]MCE9679284.1 EAL domain-containing protein [Shewanella sp. AS1]
MAKTHFLSIRWKLLIVVMAILFLVGGVISGFAYLQLHQQQLDMLESQKDEFAQSIDTTMDSVVENSLQAAMQLAFIAKESGIEGSQAYRQMLARDWADIQLYWNLSAFSLFSIDGVQLAHAGKEHTEDDVLWLLSSEASYELESRVVCAASCAIQVLVPTLIKSKPHLFLIESTLTEMLSHFRVDRDVELAILDARQEQADKEQFWQRVLYSVSNRPISLDLLYQMADKYEWEQVLEGDGVFDYQQQPWAVWFFPLDSGDNSPMLVLMTSLELWQQRVSTFQQGMAGTLLFGFLLAGGLILWIVRAPVLSLAHHARTLPLLAEHEFSEVNSSVPLVRSWLRDEVDLIHQATRELSQTMQRFESDTDEYTKELERRAMLDTLTCLPNQSMLYHELQKAIACIGVNNDRVVLLSLELDEFQRINDTLDHIHVDELIKIIAARLSNSVREKDTIFRQEGDKFLILLRHVKGDQEVRTLIHRIFAALQFPVVLGNQKLIVTASIGLTYCNEPHITAEELIWRAALALHHAKRAGRSNYRFFDEEMLNQANDFSTIELDITHGMEQEQLLLFLQPIVELPYGKLVGFEALVRWFHPERGLIMPGDFIPRIEKSDVSIALSHYLIRKAVALIGRLQQAGWDDLYLSLNLSAKQYLDQTLVQVLAEELSNSGISGHCLLLEVAEDFVVGQVKQAMAAMEAIQALGVRIAIDDFGTGYSLLNHFERQSFDLLKIDQCFISNMLEGKADSHIVTRVIESAHKLGKQVVAEGVESQAQVDFLSMINCEFAQGYHFSRPLEIESVFNILSAMQADRLWPVKTLPQLVMAKLGS